MWESDRELKMELKEDSRGHNESPRAEMAEGPITFGAQILSTEFSRLGSGAHDKVILEDTGKGQEGKGMEHF